MLATTGEAAVAVLQPGDRVPRRAPPTDEWVTVTAIHRDAGGTVTQIDFTLAGGLKASGTSIPTTPTTSRNTAQECRQVRSAIAWTQPGTYYLAIASPLRWVWK